MKATIGKYEIDHSSGFETLDEAVKFVKSIYPELDEGLIRKNVKSLVNGTNKSNNTPTKSEKGDEKHSNVRSGSSERKPSGKD